MKDENWKSIRGLFALNLLVALCMALGLSARPAEAAVGEVSRYIGDVNAVVGVHDPVHRLDLDFEGHSSSAVAPDGTVYVADINNYLVYGFGNDGIVEIVAGTGVAGDGPDEGVGTEMPIREPWGLDVDVNGNLYFTEGDRIRKLDEGGTMRTVGSVPSAVKVKVAADDLLYVAARDGQSTGGVWEVVLDGTYAGQPTRILSNVDSEGIALGDDGTLYVAAKIGPPGAETDAYVCAMDPAVPEVCTTIQRQSVFGSPVGPQFDELSVPVDCLIGYLPINPEHVVDLEIDSSGTLYLLHVQRGAQFKYVQHYGGYYPMVYAWKPGETETKLFGKSPLTLEECNTVVSGAEIPAGTQGTEAGLWFGPEISLGLTNDLLVHEQAIAIFGVPPTPKRTYAVDDVVAGNRLYFGTFVSKCADGVDNDRDGATDYPADIGCRDEDGIEDPKCSDGLDNDWDGFIDFDGGEWIHGAPLTDPDPQCSSAWDNRERAGKAGCGAAPVQAADDARGLMALAPLAIAMLALLGYGIVRNRRAS